MFIPLPDTNGRPPLPEGVCHRAVEARDPRFDGVFYVAVTTTRIYCRPICPSRQANREHRRFFSSSAAAERHGYRPCLRCRPELAPGRGLVDAVSRLASTAAQRIAAGALNGRPVGALASDLCVSERHLRRALKRELGVSPLELAQTHRLLLAKRLLADTTLDMSRVAFASGFQSLRRFNAAFRERYRMSPTALRERVDSNGHGGADGAEEPRGEPVELSLAYRAPFAWNRILSFLSAAATSGVEVVEGSRYGRTACIDGRCGVVVAEDRPDEGHLRIEVSAALVPVLMPLLARLRRVFDLDAEPAVIDAHLEEGGLGPLVRRSPGIRVPGAFDGFEAAMLVLLREASSGAGAANGLDARVIQKLGEPVESRVSSLNRLVPGAERVAGAGRRELVGLGLPRRSAATLVELATAVADGSIRLDPDGDASATRRDLRRVTGIDERLAATIVMRSVYWPDALAEWDPSLQRAAGAANERELLRRAEAWRPWRAYAAMHLGCGEGVSRAVTPGRRTRTETRPGRTR